MPLARGKPPVTNRRMATAAVCQPLAGQSAKDAGLRNCFVKVERLGIELRGERFDSILVHVVGVGGEPLADVQILQI